jgi:peptidyl-prolyl cis-trans isomerase B (cyclophilin B)
MVRRAQRQRRRRQLQAGIGAFLVVALLVVGSVWLLGGFDRQETGPSDRAERCQWLPQAPGPDRIDVGTPPVEPPTSGTRTVTMAVDAGGTGSGEITFDITLDSDPCATASLQHLAAEGFYDGTTCHELVSGALRCGDPRGSGLGGPAYSFTSGQHLPTPAKDTGAEDQPPLMYPAGTVAFGDPSGIGGSQFLLFYEDFRTDTPLWSVIGEVTGGMDLLDGIGAAGTSDSSNAPVDAVVIKSLIVTDPEVVGTPGPGGSPGPGPSPSPGGSPGPAES